MNKVILAGRLTRDPESRIGSNGLEISRFSLAAQGDYISKTTGEREVEFINCVAFAGIASTLNRYAKKGTFINTIGRLRNSNYEAKDGTKRYTTDVIIESFEFAGSKPASDGKNNNAAYDMPDFDAPAPSVETTDVSSDPYKDFGDEITLSSDDLPF